MRIRSRLTALLGLPALAAGLLVGAGWWASQDLEGPEAAFGCVLDVGAGSCVAALPEVVADLPAPSAAPVPSPEPAEPAEAWSWDGAGGRGWAWSGGRWEDAVTWHAGWVG